METTVKTKKVGIDLLEGPVFKTLLLFSIPIILTNLIQQLYGMVDLMVIGQFVGTVGTTGVTVGGEMADLITPVAMGFSTAGQIFIAQLIGAKDEEGVKDTVSTLLSFMTITALVLMIAAILFHGSILKILNCPDEAVGQATAYMIITAIGFPFIFGYNAVCGILRGMGEGKRPLIFIIVAAVVNIVLDIILVAFFDLQAAGTAIATTASQIGSFVAALIYLESCKEKLGFELKLSYFVKINKNILWILIKLGIPQVVRSLLVRFSLLWVNANINSYGLTVSSANGIGNKIQKFIEAFMQGVDTACSSMIAQNLGARKTERAKKSVWSCLVVTGTVAVIGIFCCVVIPKEVFAIFNPDPAVQDIGAVYMKCMIIHFICCALIGPFQAMVTGCGFVSLGFAIGILDGVICKVGLSYIFTRILGMGYEGFFLGIGCSRALPSLLCFLYFMSGKWKTRRLLSDQKKTAEKNKNLQT